MNTNKKSKASSAVSHVVVEIGSEWLKVIQVSRSPQGAVLSSVELAPLSDSVSGFNESVSEALAKLSLPRQAVIACLPRESNTVRLLDLPSTDPDEIGDMVQLQVGKQTPYSREEILSDYKVVGPGRDGYTSVMLVIVQRSVLRSRFSLLNDARVEVSTMSVGTEGVFHWFRAAYPGMAPGTAVAVLDVDAQFSELLVISGQRLLYTRGLRVGAKQLLTDENSSRGKLGREVAGSLQTFTAESAGLVLERLVVTGAGYNIDGLEEALQDVVGVPVEMADALQVFRRTPGEPVLHSAPYHTASLTALVGLAFGAEELELGLVPESVRLRTQLVGRARRLTALGMLVFTAVVVSSVFLSLRYFFLREQASTLSAAVSTLEPDVRQLDQKREIVRVVRGRADLNVAAVNILAEIQRLLPPPEEIAIEQIEFDGDAATVQIVGSGLSTRAIRDLVKAMEQSPYLHNVQEGGATVLRRDGRFTFRLVCMLEGAS